MGLSRAISIHRTIVLIKRKTFFVSALRVKPVFMEPIISSCAYHQHIRRAAPIASLTYFYGFQKRRFLACTRSIRFINRDHRLLIICCDIPVYAYIDAHTSCRSAVFLICRSFLLIRDRWFEFFCDPAYSCLRVALELAANVKQRACCRHIWDVPSV